MKDTSEEILEIERELVETMLYIEELITEFGILHDLVVKEVKNFFSSVKMLLDGNVLSSHISKQVYRFLERALARYDKACSDHQDAKMMQKQGLLAKEESDKSNSLIGAVVAGIACVGFGFLLYNWFKPQEPLQVLHHHDGYITENVNVNCRAHLTEDLNVRLLR